MENDVVRQKFGDVSGEVLHSSSGLKNKPIKQESEKTNIFIF
jgi:hypothetical protein